MAKLTLKHFIETSRIAQAEVWSKRPERILPSWTIIPVKETCCSLRHRWYMFPEKQGLVSTIPDLKCWIFAFYGSKTNFYVQFYFLKQAIFSIMNHLVESMTSWTWTFWKLFSQVAQIFPLVYCLQKLIWRIGPIAPVAPHLDPLKSEESRSGLKMWLIDYEGVERGSFF